MFFSMIADAGAEKPRRLGNDSEHEVNIVRTSTHSVCEVCLLGRENSCISENHVGTQMRGT